jgi:hypothetical protein
MIRKAGSERTMRFTWNTGQDGEYDRYLHDSYDTYLQSTTN